jgi:hypothetical protein
VTQKKKKSTFQTQKALFIRDVNPVQFFSFWPKSGNWNRGTLILGFGKPKLGTGSQLPAGSGLYLSVNRFFKKIIFLTSFLYIYIKLDYLFYIYIYIYVTGVPGFLFFATETGIGSPVFQFFGSSFSVIFDTPIFHTYINWFKKLFKNMVNYLFDT